MNNGQKQTLAALQKAIQMEIDGKQYYQKLSKTFKNESGRKLFAILAEEEDRHQQNFEQIYHAIEAKAKWPEIKIGTSQANTSTNLFSQFPYGQTQASASELKSVQIAIEMENKTLDYYLASADKASYLVEKQYYEALVQQERTHQYLLLEYFEFLKDPAQWFTIKEHQSLDGG